MIDIKIWLFLPAILFLGATTSYEDIKHGKIRNKWIISAIVYAAIVYILEIALSYFSENLDFTCPVFEQHVAVESVAFLIGDKPEVEVPKAENFGLSSSITSLS